jgi:histidine triad (HIT) family protein
MASIFSRIIAGEIPCYKIAENETCFAFLDITPLVRGHVLVVPKKEVDYIFDNDEQTLADLMHFAKRVAKAQKAAIDCIRIGVTVIGLEVPHTHLHLVPMNQVKDMSFTQPKITLPAEEMEDIATRIRSHFV